MGAKVAHWAMAGWTRLPTPAGTRLLMGFLAVAAASLAFAKLASEVIEGDTQAFDRAVLLALRVPGRADIPIGPHWLQEAARDVTALGGTAVLTCATAAAAGFLMLSGRRAAAVLAVAAVGGGTVLGSALKLGFDRPRPDLVPHLAEAYTASFPSGHTMLSAVTYLVLGALLMRAERNRWAKAYILVVALLTTLLVGASRVYLGLHWPTDVLAGWCAGDAWSLLCLMAGSYFHGACRTPGQRG